MAIHLGYLPLTDCLPLLVAAHQGYFAAQGLEVALCQEPSWASLRDKIGVGLLQGGHCLAPIPLATHLGLGTPRLPLVTALGLSLNGNGITLSRSLFERLCDADPDVAIHPQAASKALFHLVQAEQQGGLPPRRFAAVLPISSHFYLLHRWLGPSFAAVERVIVPPPQLVEQLHGGLIDGYCVGEPWNSLVVAENLGAVVATSEQLWPDHWEKVFAVNGAWLERHPDQHQGLLIALLNAAAWLESADHRREAVALLAAVMPSVPAPVIAASLVGPWRATARDPGQSRPRFHVFSDPTATDPAPQQAAVWLEKMRLLGQYGGAWPDDATIRQLYRRDLYESAVAAWRDTHTVGAGD